MKTCHLANWTSESHRSWHRRRDLISILSSRSFPALLLQWTRKRNPLRSHDGRWRHVAHPERRKQSRQFQSSIMNYVFTSASATRCAFCHQLSPCHSDTNDTHHCFQEVANFVSTEGYSVFGGEDSALAGLEDTKEPACKVTNGQMK